MTTQLTADASNTTHTDSLLPPRARVREQLSPLELPKQVIAYTRSIERPTHPGAFRILTNRYRFQSLSETTIGLPTSTPLDAFRVPHGLGKRMPRPKLPTRPQGFSRESFKSFRALVQSHGFQYVLTEGGLVRIAEWHPWGLFATPDVDHEPLFGGLRWYWPNTARDVPVTPRWIALGVWTFLVDRTDETPSAIAA